MFFTLRQASESEVALSSDCGQPAWQKDGWKTGLYGDGGELGGGGRVNAGSGSKKEPVATDAFVPLPPDATAVPISQKINGGGGEGGGDDGGGEGGGGEGGGGEGGGVDGGVEGGAQKPSQSTMYST